MVELHEASACTIRQARPFPTANRDSIVKKGGRSMFGLRRLAVLACADFCFTASYDFRRQSNKTDFRVGVFLPTDGSVRIQDRIQDKQAA
jgi:hypothetical protein